jgi:hypothetical protein
MTAIIYGAVPAAIGTRPVGKPASKTVTPLRTRFWEAFVESRLRQARRELELNRHLLPADLERMLARGPAKTGL